MSFVARNHPQQAAKDAVDDRKTCPDVWSALHARFGFTVDSAASPDNAHLPRFWTRETDGLAQDWSGERVWCNPPYSRIAPWVAKAMERRAEIAVLLLPANRTEQAWWQDYVEPFRRSGQIEVEFLRGRMRFIAAQDDQIRPNARPPFGVCLVIVEHGKPLVLPERDLFRSATGSGSRTQEDNVKDQPRTK